MIKKEGNKYVVKSEDGSRSFGSYNSREEAVKRLGQVEYFKHKGEYDDGGIVSSANTAESLSSTLKDSYADEDKKTRKKAKLDALKSLRDGGCKK